MAHTYALQVNFFVRYTSSSTHPHTHTPPHTHLQRRLSQAVCLRLLVLLAAAWHVGDELKLGRQAGRLVRKQAQCTTAHFVTGGGRQAQQSLQRGGVRELKLHAVLDSDGVG